MARTCCAKARSWLPAVGWPARRPPPLRHSWTSSCRSAGPALISALLRLPSSNAAITCPTIVVDCVSEATLEIQALLRSLIEQQTALLSAHAEAVRLQGVLVERLLGATSEPAQARRISPERLDVLRRIQAAGDIAHLIVTFGPHAGETLGQVARSDPDYLRQLATTAQRPDVRSAAARLVGVLPATVSTHG